MTACELAWQNNMQHQKQNIQDELRRKKRFDVIRNIVMLSIIAMMVFGVSYWLFQKNTGANQARMLEFASDVQYMGADKDNNFYKLYGDSVAKKEHEGKEILLIQKPVVEYLDAGNKWFRIRSDQADYDKIAGDVLFKQDVQIYISDGLTFFTNTAHVNTDTMLMTGQEHITGKGELFDLEAQSGFKLNKSTDQIYFYGPADFKLYSVTEDKPIHVTAKHYLEVNQRQHYYRAKGDAVAVLQKGETVTADTLLAHYNEVNGVTEMTDLEGVGHITITQQDGHVIGDRFTYGLNNQQLNVKGHVRVDMPDGDVVYCDRLKALLADKDDAASQDIVMAHCYGHVKIVTKKGDLIYSDRAIYDRVKEKMYLYDHVILDQGPSRLMGEEAVFDMTSGKSYLVNKRRTKEQVIGVLKKKQK